MEGGSGRVERDMFYFSCELILVSGKSKFPLNAMN